MAFSTMDQIRAAMPGQWVPIVKNSQTSTGGVPTSLWSGGSNPAAGTLSIGNTTSGIIPTSATAGAPPISAAGAGNELRLARFYVTAGNPGTIVVYDRLWHWGSVVLTSLATTSFTPTAVTRPDALGADVEAWLEVNQVVSATATTVQISYTNEANGSGKVGTLDAASLSGFLTMQMAPFRLAAGDRGVRSIQSVTVGGTVATTGSINLILLRRLAELEIVNLAYGARKPADALTLGFPKVYDTSCLALMALPAQGSTGAVLGGFNIVQG